MGGIFLNDLFSFGFSVTLAVNEDKVQEKELGHVITWLFESDVKKEKKIGISEVEKPGLPP